MLLGLQSLATSQSNQDSSYSQKPLDFNLELSLKPCVIIANSVYPVYLK